MKIKVICSLLPLFCSAALVVASEDGTESTNTECYADDPLNFAADQDLRQSFKIDHQGLTKEEVSDVLSQQDERVAFNLNLPSQLQDKVNTRKSRLERLAELETLRKHGDLARKDSTLLSKQITENAFTRDLPSQLQDEVNTRKSRRERIEDLETLRNHGDHAKDSTLLSQHIAKEAFTRNLPSQLQDEVNTRKSRLERLAELETLRKHGDHAKDSTLLSRHIANEVFTRNLPSQLQDEIEALKKKRVRHGLPKKYLRTYLLTNNVRDGLSETDLEGLAVVRDARAAKRRANQELIRKHARKSFEKELPGQLEKAYKQQKVHRNFFKNILPLELGFEEFSKKVRALEESNGTLSSEADSQENIDDTEESEAESNESNTDSFESVSRYPFDW